MLQESINGGMLRRLLSHSPGGFCLCWDFTAIVFTAYRGDKKYSAAGICGYPSDIREEYFNPLSVRIRVKGIEFLLSGVPVICASLLTGMAKDEFEEIV